MKYLLAALITLFSFGVSNAQCDDDVRQAFGGISSISVYNTYLTIGAVADAYVNNVYTGDRVRELMAEQKALLQSVIEMLDQCQTPKSNGLSADDVEYVKELIACLKSLKGEAQGLSDFATTGSESDQENYNFFRDRAWTQLSALLGIE